jgi:thymidine phosphorylase
MTEGKENSMEGSYARTVEILESRKAVKKLKQSVRMQNSNEDAIIAKFEALVQKADLSIWEKLGQFPHLGDLFF